jgi:hypothetical protein
VQDQKVGPVRWGITLIGGAVTVILLIAVLLTGARWSLKKFDLAVDRNSIIKIENMKPVQE